MARYFYAWTPLVMVGAATVLSLPPLGVIALVIFALVTIVALATLASAIVSVPRMLSRAISRSWRGRGTTSEPTAAALSPADVGVPPTVSSRS